MKNIRQIQIVGHSAKYLSNMLWKCQSPGRQRERERNHYRLGENMDAWKLNAVWDSGLDHEPERTPVQKWWNASKSVV